MVEQDAMKKNWTVSVTDDWVVLSNAKLASHYKLQSLHVFTTRRSRANPNDTPTKLESAEIKEDVNSSRECCAFFGVIELLEGKYLATIDSCDLVGELLHVPVYRVAEVSFVQINKSISKDSRAKNLSYTDMIKKMVEDGAMYFTQEFSLTLNVQTLITKMSTGALKSGDPASRLQSEDRFFLNKKHCQFFQDHGLNDMITPLIYGFFAVPASSHLP